jgi:sortase A
MLKRFLRLLGMLMILAGLGCIALFFIGPPGGTAGSIPAPISDHTPTQDSGEGPADKTLYLTIPKLGLKNLTVYNSYSEEKLHDSVIHLPDTGFPWQPGANTYIAGHRMGYFGTDSFLVFFRLNELNPGDEITIKDSLGREYAYRVTEQRVVGPEDVQVMDPVADKSRVSLQTCTLPDYSNRLIVQGEMVL